jgi:hypothetical protein
MLGQVLLVTLLVLIFQGAIFMITGHPDKAHKFGELVPKIVEKYPKSKCNGSATYVYLAFLYWRKNRLVDFAEGLEKALPLCLGYGNYLSH